MTRFIHATVSSRMKLFMALNADAALPNVASMLSLNRAVDVDRTFCEC